MVLLDIQPDRHRVGRAAVDHTAGSAHILNVDASVVGTAALELKSRIDRGDNVAKPPD